MSEIITFEQLKEMTGYEQPAEVAAHLAKEGVEYFTGKYNRPYTFTSMYKAAKGMITTAVEPTRIKPRIEV